MAFKDLKLLDIFISLQPVFGIWTLHAENTPEALRKAGRQYFTRPLWLLALGLGEQASASSAEK